MLKLKIAYRLVWKFYFIFRVEFIKLSKILNKNLIWIILILNMLFFFAAN